MDKKIQELRACNENRKNDMEKFVSAGFPMSLISSETSICEHIDYLLQQIEIKDKALGFYADRENWRVGPFRVTEVELDNGRCARAALKGEDTNATNNHKAD